MKTEEVVQNMNVESVAEKIAEDEKVIETEKTIEVEKIIEVVMPCTKCLEACKECAAKDEIIAEYEKKKEQLLFNLNYVKESYDVLNKTVTGLQKTNSEREQTLTMMNAVMMSKQKAINFYIEESAKWKQELETENIENERIKRLLQSYSSSDYLIDRIYPTVAGMEAFQEDKPKKKDSGGSAEEEQKKPLWRQANQEFLAEKRKNGTEVFHQRETRTCFKCNKAGLIAWNCTKNAKTKHGVSRKLKEKVKGLRRSFQVGKCEAGIGILIGKCRRNIPTVGNCSDIPTSGIVCDFTSGYSLQLVQKLLDCKTVNQGH
ncbi:putative transcription factor interactor and regulator CCHC(Zn) family [Helianthus debilis subsp. tardiflorus]